MAASMLAVASSCRASNTWLWSWARTARATLVAACCLMEDIWSPRTDPEDPMTGSSIRSDSTMGALLQPGASRPHRRLSVPYCLAHHLGGQLSNHSTYFTLPNLSAYCSLTNHSSPYQGIPPCCCCCCCCYCCCCCCCYTVCPTPPPIWQIGGKSPGQAAGSPTPVTALPYAPLPRWVAGGSRVGRLVALRPLSDRPGPLAPTAARAQGPGNLAS